MSIFEVRHQLQAQRLLQRALSCERMPHAYLFAGPEGVGKEMLAVRLAKTILCASPVQRKAAEDCPDVPAEGYDACGQCRECQLVDAGTHPDLSIIHRQLNKQHPDSTVRRQKALFLTVDVIRHFLTDRAGVHASRGRAKVFIVREAQRMNDAAQNSLLKTLEEPPPNTFIILISEAVDRMLPTTRSRCQHVPFRTLPVEFVNQQLATLRPDVQPEQRYFAAMHSAGSLGTAMRCLEDGLFELKKAWLDRLFNVLKHRGREAPHLLAKPFLEDAKGLGKHVLERDPDVSDLDATRAGVQEMLAFLAHTYADALKRQVGSELRMVHADQQAIVDEISRLLDAQRVRESIGYLADAESQLTRNAHAELTLETLFIRLARQTQQVA